MLFDTFFFCNLLSDLKCYLYNLFEFLAVSNICVYFTLLRALVPVSRRRVVDARALDVRKVAALDRAPINLTPMILLYVLTNFVVLPASFNPPNIAFNHGFYCFIVMHSPLLGSRQMLMESICFNNLSSSSFHTIILC